MSFRNSSADRSNGSISFRALNGTEDYAACSHRELASRGIPIVVILYPSVSFCEILMLVRCHGTVRLSEKCLPLANVFFTTVHLRTNVKPSLRNVAVFVSAEQDKII